MNGTYRKVGLVAPVQQVVDLVNKGDVWIQANYKETQPTDAR